VMKAFAKNHKRILTVAVIVLFFMSWNPFCAVRGHLAGLIDIERENYEILAFGLPPTWMPEYARLLRDRYGIRLRRVANCTVSESLVSYVRSYNEVSTAAANRKFGRDVFKECAEDARNNWAHQNTATKSLISTPDFW
jgi:hypothetical protein